MIPENILNKMSEADRRAIGQQTIEEATDGYHDRIEREESKVFTQWLSLHEIPCLRANPSKKSTIMAGWPDYSIFWNGDVIFIELKSPGRKLRPEQDKVLKMLATQGFKVRVCYSAKEAIERVREWRDSFAKPKHGMGNPYRCEECGTYISADMQICLDCDRANQDRFD